MRYTANRNCFYTLDKCKFFHPLRPLLNNQSNVRRDRCVYVATVCKQMNKEKREKEKKRGVVDRRVYVVFSVCLFSVCVCVCVCI
jgi:hypothetical protein